MVTHSVTALVMAGGTGGHVFPALAVAEALRSQGIQVHWLGTRRGMEAGVVPGSGIEISYIEIGGLRGKGLLKWVTAPFKILQATYSAMKIIASIKPDVVLGMGGFVTGPGGLASRIMGKPLVIHEQNAIAGLTNKLLSKIASRVLQAFPGTFSGTDRVFHTGNPVRESINRLDKPDTRYSAREGNLQILVVGGSLGAQALNETVPDALAMIEEPQRPIVWHQSGRNKLQATEARYKENNIDARTVEFIDDMHEAYGWADLIICRAGAMTVTEISNAGIASILVPYPYAVDDHQSANARYLANAGAAILIQQVELTPRRLADELLHLISAGRTELMAMANRALTLARPDATQTVAQHCLEVAHG